MKVFFHPDFPKQVKNFQSQYQRISERLEKRFQIELNKSIERIKESPHSAGHFVKTDSQIVKEVRRRNLTAFPFFLLYGVSENRTVFRSIIANASDPLTWLRDFPGQYKANQ